MKSLADNDILYKGSCYQLLDSLIGESRADVGVLGAPAGRTRVGDRTSTSAVASSR
jgi:hypothetical protein